ncbi:hypothetical protein ABW20_dc0103200 [Dactylellina cionopaga]|nr:hypothetical protein ABW20_dc0103200 [Dactylellina cionopaga]
MPPKPEDQSPSQGAGLGASRFAQPTNRNNPFYGGPLDPRHRDPTAVVLEASTGSLEADPVARTYQTWHRVEDTGSKIIFHLDEINCLVRGFVRSKDGSVQDTKGTATQATANLSIVLDKVLVFGKNQDFAVTDKGYFLEDDSVLRFNSEGDGGKGRAPALGVGINKAENEKPGRVGEPKVTPAVSVAPNVVLAAPVASEKKSSEVILREIPAKQPSPNVMSVSPPAKPTAVSEKPALVDAKPNTNGKYSGK